MRNLVEAKEMSTFGIENERQATSALDDDGSWHTIEKEEKPMPTKPVIEKKKIPKILKTAKSEPDPNHGEEVSSSPMQENGADIRSNVSNREPPPSPHMNFKWTAIFAIAGLLLASAVFQLMNNETKTILKSEEVPVSPSAKEPEAVKVTPEATRPPEATSPPVLQRPPDKSFHYEGICHAAKNLILACRLISPTLNLQLYLEKRLHGQPLAIASLVSYLKKYMEDEESEQALVLSFHGTVNIGKQFTAGMIAEHINEKELSSVIFPTAQAAQKTAVPHFHFLKSFLSDHNKKHRQSVYVFPNVDEMPEFSLHELASFIRSSCKDADSKKSYKNIFILTSTIGGEEISSQMTEYAKKGMERGRVPVQTLQKTIEVEMRKNKEMGSSELVKDELITHYVPFLPLEREHVRLCIDEYVDAVGLEMSAKEREQIAKTQRSDQKHPKFIAAGCANVQKAVSDFTARREKCRNHDCCGKSPVKGDFTGLEASLKRQLYGQPFVVAELIGVLKAHYNNDEPKKALVVSFHGTPGVGKNYVAKFITEHIYHENMRNEHVFLYVAKEHFKSHEAADVAAAQEKLRSTIREVTRNCTRNLFIFDELDYMPPGVLDVLKAFVDYHDELDGINFRRNTFIFLSNVAGEKIMTHLYSYWKRANAQLHKFQEIIQDEVYNNKDGGLYRCELIRSHLIDVFMPFLPLEEEQLALCVDDYAKQKRYSLSQDERLQIARSIKSHPYYTKYAEAGCKSVMAKTEQFIARRRSANNGA